MSHAVVSVVYGVIGVYRSDIDGVMGWCMDDIVGVYRGDIDGMIGWIDGWMHRRTSCSSLPHTAYIFLHTHH